ncbi:MAG: acyltransferase family protein [Opitutaceae bacterium]|jgi:peptidoglycan/LPS O-acetylase OafA/YrhL
MPPAPSEDQFKTTPLDPPFPRQLKDLSAGLSDDKVFNGDRSRLIADACAEKHLGEPGGRPYLAPLDGIRAVAILAVLIFHVWPAALPGGFTGVDVFYALSGYLITSIILYDIGQSRFSLKEFYLRRIQRLLPNAIVTVLVVIFLWTFFLPPNAAIQPAVHGLWTLFNLSNFYVWRNLGGYWGTDAGWAPLTHFWSLGIEEQFYLLFPSTLLLLTRSQPGRIRSWLIVATLLSFGLCLYGTGTSPAATFYLLPTRVWELLLGAALAAHRLPIRVNGARRRVPWGERTREIAGWTGLGLIVSGFWWISDAVKFPGFAALAPTVGTALVLVSVAAGDSRISRLLSTRFMVQTGKLSYSIYLWHWPMIIFGKTQAAFFGLPQLVGAAAGGLAGILLAWAAYIGIERPLRNRGPGRSWRLATIVAGFSIAVLGCVVVAGRRVEVDPGHRFDTPTSSLLLFDVGRNSDPADLKTVALLNGVDSVPCPLHEKDIWRKGGIVHLYGGGYPRVVVLGSSQALMFSKLIDDICRKNNISVAYFGADCGTPAYFEATVNPLFPSKREAQEFDEARRKYLGAWRPEAVFVADLWARFKDPNEFEARSRGFLKEISPMAGRIFFVAQIPIVNLPVSISPRAYVVWCEGAGNNLPILGPDSGEFMRKQALAKLETLTTDFPNLRVLRADIPFYQKDGSIRYAEGRNFFYLDRDHVTDRGAEEDRALFQDAINEAHAASRP